MTNPNHDLASHPHLVSAHAIMALLANDTLSTEQRTELTQAAAQLLTAFYQQTQDELAYLLAKYQLVLIKKDDAAVEITGWRLYELTEDANHILQMIDYYEFIQGKHYAAITVAEQLQDFAFSEADRKTATKKLAQLLA